MTIFPSKAGRCRAPQPEAPVTWYRLVSAELLPTPMGMPIAARPQLRSRARRRRRSSSTRRSPRDVLPERRGSARPARALQRVGGRAVVHDRRRRRRRARCAARARRAASRRRIIPYWQFTEPGMNVVLKTAGDPGAAGRAAASGGARRSIRICRSSGIDDAGRRSSRTRSTSRASSPRSSRLRRAGAGAGGDRHLRRDGVRGRAADDRDRRADGARRRRARRVPRSSSATA